MTQSATKPAGRASAKSASADASANGHGGAPSRIVIQYPKPIVDGGRFPVKRCVGDTVEVSVDIFRDGHDMLRAVIRHQQAGAKQWQETELLAVDAADGGVRWAGSFDVELPGEWLYDIEAWRDRYGTWRTELERKRDGGQHDLSSELSEGLLLLSDALENLPRAKRKPVKEAVAALSDSDLSQAVRCETALDEDLYALLREYQPRTEATRLPAPVKLTVDRERAGFGSWYELFPRSFGGLRGVEAVLPTLAELGFDVLYLPPIHPIGLTNRKGANNSLTAGPDDPGSPWAIGDEHGGHKAVHPDLGTVDDLRSLTAAAKIHGLEIALDFAIQCSADHPWLTEHPDWFNRRPDGTLKYAENPPKKYQDIYNVNWESDDWQGLWNALLDVVLQWVDCGVTIFRVDNPHTKPAPFWEWLIAQVHERDPDVLFLSEAFTRRAVMRHLAKVGFNQSYTYFTWKNSRWELTEYVTELAYSGEQDYLRPNFFVNTPDILHAYLQHGGRPAFEARLVLAATLSPNYGIYSGFEQIEATPVREGSEEYLDSEKYELKQRSLDGPLMPMVSTINHARREHPALQQLSNVTFLATENEALIAYAKQTGDDTVITVVNLDPHSTQEGVAVVPAHLGLPPVFPVRDLLDGEQFQWRIGPNYVRLEPGVRQAHICAVQA